MSSNKVDNGNSNGVSLNPNRVLTTISHASSPGAFCKPIFQRDEGWMFSLPWRANDAVTCPTDAVCPDCGQNLISEGRIVYSYPFDDVMECRVESLVLKCLAQGCDFVRPRKAGDPPQPEHLESHTEAQVARVMRGIRS